MTNISCLIAKIVYYLRMSANTKNWSRENLAWAAGLFDGEGCIHLSRSGYIRLTLGMTDLDVVEKFSTVLGCGNIYKHRRFKGQREYKSCFIIQISGFEKVQAILAAFWPWLGARRRAKMELALNCARRPLTARQLAEGLLTVEDLGL